MTPAQSRVRQAFLDLQKGDIPPSIREVCAHTRLGVQTVHSSIEELIDLGMMVTDSGRKHRKYRAIGAFDNEALDRMCHADLVALRDLIDQRLTGRRIAA